MSTVVVSDIKSEDYTRALKMITSRIEMSCAQEDYVTALATLQRTHLSFNRDLMQIQDDLKRVIDTIFYAVRPVDIARKVIEMSQDLTGKKYMFEQQNKVIPRLALKSFAEQKADDVMNNAFKDDTQVFLDLYRIYSNT